MLQKRVSSQGDYLIVNEGYYIDAHAISIPLLIYTISCKHFLDLIVFSFHEFEIILRYSYKIA